jgi:two-component system, sensor histidine kinase LadS
VVRVKLPSLVPFVACCLLWPLAARAQELDVGADLRAVDLESQVDVLEDPSAALDIEQIVGQHFKHQPGHKLSFGFSDSAFWLRLRVRNSAQHARAFLLEVGRPQLDYVTLYVPRENGGYEVRRTGDQLPFSLRDLAYRNFVFTLEQPAGVTQTYYLRVASEGLVELLLSAWTVEEFVEHQHLDWAGLCVFYGALLVLALYTFAIWVSTREGASLQLSLLVLSTCWFQFAYVGHATQYLFPNSRYLAQVVVSVALGMNVAAHTWFGKHVVALVDQSARVARLFNVLIGWLVLVTLASLFVSVRTSLRIHLVQEPLLTVFALAMTVREIRRGSREARFVLVAYGLVFVGALLAVATNLGYLPNNVWTQWCYQLGASLQYTLLVVLSGMRLRSLNEQLVSVNGELAYKVDELEEAVVRAERATRLTEWATRVKDEFMATMSHELRTPLNTIINIPQGLVEEFVVEAQAVCRHCASVFELEPGEQLSAATSCPSCAQAGTLSERERVRFAGDATRAVRYLEKIERSGTHLLGVVNGMLQADKAESGQVALAPEWTDVAALARDVVDDLSDLALRAGVELTLRAPAEPLEQSVDPLRLRQVLINLIGNALKFSNGRGTVTVYVERQSASCLFSVHDEGIGIAEGELENIFGSYQQGDGARTFGGTGLGLSISRSLVRAHGGELQVQSELGKGSTFSFHIPQRRREQKTA